GNLFQLQGAFEGERVIQVSSEIEEVLFLAEDFRQGLDFFGGAQRLSHPARDFEKVFRQGRRLLFRKGSPEVGEVERQKKKRGQLGRESFGGGHADLGAAVGVKSRVRRGRDGGSEHVADRERPGPGFLGEPEGGQGVRRFAGLGDKNREVIFSEKGC